MRSIYFWEHWAPTLAEREAHAALAELAEKWAARAAERRLKCIVVG